MLWLLFLYDAKINRTLYAGRCDLHFTVHRVCLNSWRLFDLMNIMLEMLHLCDTKTDLIIYVGLCDQHFIVHWFYLTWWRLFHGWSPHSGNGFYVTPRAALYVCKSVWSIHHASVIFPLYLLDGWMICDFTPFSTVFQSYQDNGPMIIKGCVQWSPVYGSENFALIWARTLDR